MDLNKDIQDTIEKHLPAQIGEVLKKRLDEIPRLEDEVKTLTEDLKTVSAISNERKRTNQELSEQLKTHQELDIRLTELEKRERNLELELCRKDVSCAQEKANQLFGLVNSIFKNPTYKENIAKTSFGSENVPVTNNGYTTTQSMSTHFNENVTTTRSIDDIL